MAREGALWELDQKRRAAAEPLWRLREQQVYIPAEPTGAALSLSPTSSSSFHYTHRTCLLTPAGPLLQYVFDITKEEDEVLISLQQKDLKIHRKDGQGENLTIGYGVFKVKQVPVATTLSSI